jgi:hypothetical protein
MCDDVTCELAMPDGRVVEKDSFQTKSLCHRGALFTITAAGRLVCHQGRYSNSPMVTCVGDIDLDYHGDIEIHG